MLIQNSGKIDFNDPRWSRLEKLNMSLEQGELYSMVAYCRFLKQQVRMVIRFSKNEKKWKLYFSTDWQ